MVNFHHYGCKIVDSSGRWQLAACMLCS